MIKNNKKGFTLVELLAVIVILGVIASIGIFAINNTIKKSKEKSYQVTIKNVEAQASNYLMENSGKLFFISTDDGKEYQCVTIQDLIDFGYLKDNVTESFIADKTNVNKNDYIYLERDAVSKAITQSKYTFSDGEIINCTKAIEATADIAILVTHDGEWAKKKTVTIEYRLKDLYDVNELKNYLYGYTFSEQSEENNEALKKFDVSKNGTVTATIKYKDKTITKNKVIDRIDTTAPIISLGDYDAGVKARQATVNLVVTDTESGVNISSFTKDDLIIKIGDEVLSTDNYTLTYKNNGTYELKIQDDNHEGKVVIQVDNDKVFDKAENGNLETILEPNITFSSKYTITYDANGGSGAPSPTEYTYATSGTVTLSSQKPTRIGYTFLGWATSKTATTAEYAAGASYNKNNANNVTLYAVWKVNQVTIKYNANGGVMSANHGATFSLDGNSNVLKNNSVYTNIINYGGKLGTDGLLNYDNSSYLKVEKTGYNVPSGSEWNTKTDGTGTSYNQSTVYNASDFCNASNDNCEVTLYVNWKAKTVKITYDANGGTGAPSATEYTYATSGTVSLSSQKPTRTGYAFLGWSTSKTATSATYAAGASYNKNNPNNVTLYAVWNINQIKITLDGNGATSGGTSSIYVENNSNVITPNSIVLPKRKYTITYNANDTEATMPPDTIVNYTLNGWYSAADGDSLIINNSSTPAFSSSTVSGYISDGKWGGTETKTLYAHWTDSHITLPYLSYNGHRCNWNTKADGTGEHYPMGATNFTTDKDITLYAICQHVCCHTGIGNCNNCRSDEISNGTGCYRTSGTNVNGTILENNICESLVTNKDTCGGYGWEDCNYTFTDCDQSCDDSGTPDPEPGGCRGSCDSGYHFDYNCKCVKDSSGSSGGGCFLAGTKVMTTMGLKDINKVKIGDMVLTYNEKRGINEYHLVTKKFYFKPNEIDESLYTLSIDDKTSLQVSSTHRFYIKRNNEFLWLRTKKMQVGDYIRYADGSYHKIINIHNEELTKPVYNLTVDDTHNFYVGEQLILVHNVNCGHFEGGRCRDSDYK